MHLKLNTQNSRSINHYMMKIVKRKCSKFLIIYVMLMKSESIKLQHAHQVSLQTMEHLFVTYINYA